MSFFFFNDTATTEIYTLSLHDALPISRLASDPRAENQAYLQQFGANPLRDRKSTRLNSSHLVISYAVFCLKKKKKKIEFPREPPRSCHIQTGACRRMHQQPKTSTLLRV